MLFHFLPVTGLSRKETIKMNKVYFLSLIVFLTAFFKLQISTASEFKAGENVEYNTPVNHNLYVACNKLQVKDSVRGDILAAASKISIQGWVEGDLMLTGGQTKVSGTVMGDIRVASGEILIEKDVMGDLVVFSGQIEVSETSVIYGDVIVFSGDVEIKGILKGGLILKAGSASLNGKFEGPVHFEGDDLELNGSFLAPVRISAEEIETGDSLRIFHTLDYWSEEGKIEFDSFLQNGGKVFWNPELARSPDETYDYDPGAFLWFFGIATAFSALMVILFLVNFFLRIYEEAGSILRGQFIHSFGYGILFFLGVPVLCFLLSIIIIGLPLAALIFILYLILLFMGNIFTSLVLAIIAKDKFGKKWNRWTLAGVAFFIYLILKGLMFIPVIGWLISAVLSTAGIGALIKAIRLSRQTQKPI